MLELPRGTVNSRLRRALDRLSGLIGEAAMREARLREALLDARRSPTRRARESAAWRLVAGRLRGVAAGAPARAPHAASAAA